MSKKMTKLKKRI